MNEKTEKKLSKPINIFFFGNEQIAQGIKQKSTPIFNFFAQNPNFNKPITKTGAGGNEKPSHGVC